MKLATYLPRILWLIGASLLLIVPALAESVENARAAASDPCAKTVLHCESYGSGDPIIALHGLGGTLYSWHNFERSFPNHRLILIDLKGAGGSPRPHDKKYSVADQAEIILQFILQNDLKNLTLMGNSYGGAVALFLSIELCNHHSGYLSSLILIDSGGYNRDLPAHLKVLMTPLVGWLAVHLVPPRVATRKVLRDSYYAPDRISKGQLDAYTDSLAAPGGRYALLQTGKQAIPPNIKEITDQYPTIKVPTLIVWGLDDRLLPIKIGRMLHEAIPYSTLELVVDCGHVPQEEAPDETMRYISAFFGRLGQTP